MASTYSSNLNLELITTGEKAGTWGTITNTNLQQLEQDTKITNNEAIHPIEILAKAYKLI